MFFNILIRVSLLEESSAKRQEDKIFEDLRPVTSITYREVSYQHNFGSFLSHENKLYLTRDVVSIANKTLS